MTAGVYLLRHSRETWSTDIARHEKNAAPILGLGTGKSQTLTTLQN